MKKIFKIGMLRRGFYLLFNVNLEVKFVSELGRLFHIGITWCKYVDF